MNTGAEKPIWSRQYKYGLDRQAIIGFQFSSWQGMPAYGPLQRNIYNCEDVEHYDYNPEKAKEILKLQDEMGDDGFYYRDGEKGDL